MIDWYVNMIVNHPRKIIATIVVLCSTIIAFPFFMGYSLQFSDPQLGFETRGTTIGNRHVAWDNLIKVLERGIELVDDITRIPANILPKRYEDVDAQRNYVEFQFGNKKHNIEIASKNINKSLPHTTELDDEVFDESEMMTLGRDKKRQKNRLDFFCAKPTYEHARVVFTISDGENLLSYQAIKDMCLIQERLENLAEYKDVCDKQDNACCPPWSLVNYITLMRKHMTCSEIIPKDINATQTILDGCAHYYHDNQLLEWQSSYRTIPHQCVKFKAVYNMMHYHLDVNFMPPHAPTKILSSSLMFLPFGKGSIINLYEAMNDANLSTSLVKISAVDFGIKEKLFDLQLVKDIYLIFLSIVFIVFCVFAYTWSLTISLVTVLNIIFSLSISYFIYTFILCIQFFPFMNILAVIILIGISADSSFIMCDVWKSVKDNDVTHTLDEAIYKTLKHSLLSISLSTTITFFAFASSFLSSISGISCFSIFSSIAVLANLVITTSLLPACIVLLNSKYTTAFNVVSINHLLSKDHSLRWIQTSFNMWLLKMVFRFRLMWTIFFTTLGVISAYIILIWPVMKLPESLELQLFQKSHPFEQYDLIYKNQFWFERILGADNNPENRLPLWFVWGVFPNDTGNRLDPEDHGNLIYDPNFDVAHPRSQSWLLQFCIDLRTQLFYQSVGGPHLTNCFIETFISWMDQDCKNSLEPNRWPCCNTFKFPYPRNVFHFCIIKAMNSIYNTPSSIFIPTAAGPKFSNPLYQMSNKTYIPIIKAVVVEFESNFTFSTSYIDMKRFFNQVESWSSKIMNTAPPGLRDGWFYSHLGFFDLQRVLINDTVISTVISLVFVFIVLLIVTKSVLLTTLTIITIFFIMCSTMAVLVLMGWHLNVLESIAISVAIGLSVDFSVHYTIEYQLACEYSSRAVAISKALYLMACPSLMGAVTTGATGAFMLPSDVLPYAQLGIFLIIIMFVSWLYSTFYLVSLLSFIGPESNHGPYAYRCCKELRNINTDGKHSHRPRHAVTFSSGTSESPLSCLSTSINPLTVVEMETLTAKTLPAPITKVGNSCFYVKIDEYNNVGKDETNNVHV